MAGIDENGLANGQASDTEKALFLTTGEDGRMVITEHPEAEGEEDDAVSDAAESLELSCDWLMTKCLVAIISGNLRGVSRETIETTLDHLAASDVVNNPTISFSTAYAMLGRDRHEKMLLQALAAFRDYEQTEERKTECHEN